jgi:glycosyltransferase involved in cell wall biosynthesis
VNDIANDRLCDLQSSMKPRLKILFLSQPFLYPLDTGGKIRTAKLLEQLTKIFDITLISNFDPSKDKLYFDSMTALCREYHPVRWNPIKKYSPLFYLRLLTRIFSRYPIVVLNDYSKEIEETILRLLSKERYDLLICDFLQPSLNFCKVVGFPILLFQHNVESVIARRHFDVAANPFLKLFWWSQWRKMQRYEREICQRFTGTVTVSERDKALLEEEFGARNVFSIPTGIDTNYFVPVKDSEVNNSLVFTGSMDWLPNEDAILFFAREILPRIKEQIPEVKLTVVGRNPSRALLNEVKNFPEIELTGWVKDVRPFIARHGLYVIPLRIGGGTRIKVYEAMAMGKAIISTRIGVEGLPVRNGDNVLVSDEPEEFANAVVRLLKDVKARRSIEINARAFVETNFSWEKAAEVFSNGCVKAIKGESGALFGVSRAFDLSDFETFNASVTVEQK